MADTFDIANLEKAVELAGKVKYDLENVRPAKIDTDALQEASEFMQLIQQGASMSSQDFASIRDAISVMARQKAIMSANPFVTPADKQQIEELEQILVNMGVNVKALNQAWKQEEQIVSGTTSKHKKTSQFLKRQAKSMANYAQSATGIQLSLVGIIALIIKLMDINNRISAYSEQIAAHWGDGEKNLRASTSSIWKLRKGFKMTFEQAAEYQKSLARAGMEKKNILGISDDLLAVEKVYGQSLASQVQYVQGLVGNFAELGAEEKDRADSAMLYMETVRQTVKDIPMLSMEDALSDWSDLVNLNKAYNTDLLGTLGMYKILMDQDLAETMGLGDTPRVLRKQVGEFFVGMPQQMSDGMKAALGGLMEGGETRSLTENIFKFEGSKVEERVRAFSKFIEKNVPDFASPEGMFKVRKILMGLGQQGQEMAVKLSEAYGNGKLTGNKLEDVIRSISQEREKAKDQEKKAQATRENLVKKGMDIATNLTGYLEKLQQWIVDNLLGPVQDLTRAIAYLADKMPSERDATHFWGRMFNPHEEENLTKRYLQKGGGAALRSVRKRVGFEKFNKQFEQLQNDPVWGTVPEAGRMQKAYLANPEKWMQILENTDESNMKKMARELFNLVQQYNRKARAVRKSIPQSASAYTKPGSPGA